MRNFTLALVDGPQPSSATRLERQVVLSVENETPLIGRVLLDSDIAKRRVSKQWSERFDLDHEALTREFDKLGAEVMSQQLAERRRRESADENRRELSAVLDEFIAGLKPLWHRQRKSIYSEAKQTELQFNALWTHVPDDVIRAVAETREGMESGHKGTPPSFKTCVSLLKDAVQLAATRAMDQLPSHLETEHLSTLEPDQLETQLVAWLLRERSFRLDCGTLQTTNYYTWAGGVEIGAWAQCFTAPVFARRQDAIVQPSVAMTGAILTSDLRWESNRHLAKELRTRGLAVTDAKLRLGKKTWRVWEFTARVLDAIGSDVAEDTK